MNRTMSIEELQQSQGAVKTPSSLKNYRSTLNTINKEFGWDKDIIHYDNMNNNAENIAKFINKKWIIKNLESFSAKLSHLGTLMTRTGWGKQHNINTIRNNIETHTKDYYKPDTVKMPDIPKWTDLQKKLKELGTENSNRGTVARIFSHGYVLRISELFNTNLINPKSINYLNLETGEWIIRNQKNSRQKKFTIPQELCKTINKGTWLLRKTDTTPYSACNQDLHHLKWPLNNNHTMRKSYETWNRHESGRTEEEKNIWHNILGHSLETVQKYYNQEPLKPETHKITVKCILKPKIKVKCILKKNE